MVTAQNPFYAKFNTEHETPPFSKINNSHWEEAISRGIREREEEINAIASQTDTPTFENTSIPYAKSGEILDRVLHVFGPLLSACSDEEMMDVQVKMSPILSAHTMSVILNEKLWERVKYVYEHQDEFNLDSEEKMMLRNQYEEFARNGALLQGEDREKLAAYVAELSQLTTTFSQNVLKELKTYEIYLKKDDLAGITERLVNQAADDAKAKGREGEYLFTLAQPTYFEFMRTSERADLRERMYRLYCGRNQKGEFDNTKILVRIVELRCIMAHLLGRNYMAYASLERRMAKNKDNVYDLLYKLRDAYKPAMEREIEEMTAFAGEMEGHSVKIKPWDYSYYFSKMKEVKYGYDPEMTRPYFELGNVIKGVFGLATKLYGLTFVENPRIEVYHPDVKAYDVKDEDGSFLGVLYADFFPRDNKQPGAWMTEFADQYIDEDDVNHRPQVTIVMNFTKPQGDEPSLLKAGEVQTFLHEFGHALHGLMANTRFASMSGTAVERDFVELPSQFNENYVDEKEFLDTFAVHYKTGEKIPQELVDKMVGSARFGAGYSCLRQLGFALLDMAYATLEEVHIDDVAEFEKQATESVKIFDHVDGTLISPTFSHIFAGGYAAGYYSYKWSEVLSADVFSVFKKNGIFDRATAKSFRDNILSKGGTEEADVLYRRFRGQDVTIDALLERDGIK